LYSAGQPGGARADRLLYQARLALDEDARLKVVKQMYRVRFGDEPPAKRSVNQLRGIEGARVRQMYKLFAKRFGVPWTHRESDPDDWNQGDLPNRCLSAATAALYGITESAVLAAGYAPAIGFIHTGKPLSFVYDMADLFKFETVVPVAFQIAAKNPANSEQEVRHACREVFRSTRLLQRIIPMIEDVLAAGGLSKPEPPEDALPPAIPEKEGLGDDGHRS
jgi:CRISP-associated protein Cas1